MHREIVEDMRFFLIFLFVFCIILPGCSLPWIHNFTNDHEMWGEFVKGGKYSLERDVFITRNKNDYWEMSPSFNMYNNVRIYPDSLNIMNKIEQFDRERYEYVAILKKNTAIEMVSIKGESNYFVGKRVYLGAKVLDGEYAGKVVTFYPEMCKSNEKEINGWRTFSPSEFFMKPVETP